MCPAAHRPPLPGWRCGHRPPFEVFHAPALSRMTGRLILNAPPCQRADPASQRPSEPLSLIDTSCDSLSEIPALNAIDARLDCRIVFVALRRVPQQICLSGRPGDRPVCVRGSSRHVGDPPRVRNQRVVNWWGRAFICGEALRPDSKRCDTHAASTTRDTCPPPLTCAFTAKNGDLPLRDVETPARCAGTTVKRSKGVVADTLSKQKLLRNS